MRPRRRRAGGIVLGPHTWLGNGPLALPKGRGADASSIYWGNVATRIAYPTIRNTSYTEAMIRSAHFARDRLTGVKIGWLDAYTTSETASGATTTITAAIEYPEGVFTPITFAGGSSSGSNPSGGLLECDEAAVIIPDGEIFWTREFRLNANGLLYQQYFFANEALGDRVEAGTSVVDKTAGGTITSNISILPTPSYIIAQTRKPTIFIPGDSKAAGVDDTSGGNTRGDVGEVARSIGSRFGYINCGVAGEGAGTSPASMVKRRLLAAKCSHLISNFGINDVRAPVTIAVAKQRILDLHGVYNGMDGKFHVKIAPATVTGTTDWSSLETQTVETTNTVRQQVNDWLDTLPDNIISVVDVPGVVESAAEPGKWVPNYTDDGIHENPTSYDAVEAANLFPIASIVRPAALVNPDQADIWLNAFATPPSEGQEAAYRAFIMGLVSDSLFDAFDILHIEGASDVQSGRINVIDPKSFGLSRYGSPTFVANQGFKGDGVSADLSTHYRPSIDGNKFTLDSASIFVYSHSNDRVNGVLFGQSSSGGRAYIAPWNLSVNAAGHALNSGAVNAFVPSSAEGLFTLSRTASTGYKVFRNETLLGTQTATSTSLSTLPLRVCSGLASYNGVQTAKISGAGRGLLDAEVALLSARCAALSNALVAL